MSFLQLLLHPFLSKLYEYFAQSARARVACSGSALEASITRPRRSTSRRSTSEALLPATRCSRTSAQHLHGVGVQHPHPATAPNWKPRAELLQVAAQGALGQGQLAGGLG